MVCGDFPNPRGYIWSDAFGWIYNNYTTQPVLAPEWVWKPPSTADDDRNWVSLSHWGMFND